MSLVASTPPSLSTKHREMTVGFRFNLDKIVRTVCLKSSTEEDKPWSHSWQYEGAN